MRGLGWEEGIGKYQSRWLLFQFPLACPTSPILSHSAPRILRLPIFQSVIPIHIQVSVAVRILFAAAHDEARACGKQDMSRTRGQRDYTKRAPSVASR